jgi:ribonuclease HI
MAKELVVFTDGGARGNPGPAGIGVAIYLNDGGAVDPEKMTLLKTIKKYIGEATNNVAEYTALLTAMETASELDFKDLKCVLDSELVVKQLNGEYRIKEPSLQVLASKIKALSKNFNSVTFTHIRREKNKLADQLVNEAIDEAQK